MSLVELFREGSDPEFSFALPDNKGKITLLSADALVGADKDLRLRSFIGTDGHPSTAELRPAPCHNVYWHLCKIADGLREVERSLAYYSQKKERPIVAVAQPSLGKGETMGGHIWISMWYKDQMLHDLVHRAGVLWDNYRVDFQPTMQIHSKAGGPLTPSKVQAYQNLAMAGQTLTADLPWRKLHYLLGPLEMMLYGTQRKERAVGVKDAFMRVPNNQTETDIACYRPGSAYFRFEYRFPTTWLQHPTLAFVYLGLAKLAILNWDLLPDHKSLHLDVGQLADIHSSATPTFRDLLKKRVEELLAAKGVRITKDLKGLTDALAEVYKVKLKFPALINFEAWAALRPPR